MGEIANAIVGSVQATNDLGLGITSAIQRKKERDQALNLTRETNAQNLDIMKENWRREDTAYQRAVDDAKKAGLSAFSVAGTGGSNAGDVVSMSNPADAVNSAGSFAGALADMRNSVSNVANILGAKAQIEKTQTETANLEQGEKRAQQEHLLLMEKMGIDVSNLQRQYDVDFAIKDAQKKHFDVLTDTTLSEEERKKELHIYQKKMEALETEEKSLKLEEEKKTVYNPEFSGQRVSNYRTKLATDNANMVYENNINRQRSEMATLEKNKYATTSDQEIAKNAYNLQLLEKELKYADAKAKSEIADNITNAIKNGASSVEIVIGAVKKVINIKTAIQLLSGL